MYHKNTFKECTHRIVKDELNNHVQRSSLLHYDKSIIKSANIHRNKVSLVKSDVAMHVIAFKYSLMGMWLRLFAFMFLSMTRVHSGVSCGHHENH